MELKFRAYNKTDKVMIFNLNSPRLIDGVLTGDDDDILMMFTGLQDKNGVDIFQGDLMSNGTGRTCKVVWHEYAACWDAEPINEIGSSHGGKANQWRFNMEVIGNIHQHPELMEK